MLQKKKNVCVESCSLSLQEYELGSDVVSHVLQCDMLLELTVENWKKKKKKKNYALVASGGTMFIAGFAEISLLADWLKAL